MAKEKPSVSVPLRGLGVFGVRGKKEFLLREKEGFRPLAGIRGIRRLEAGGRLAEGEEGFRPLAGIRGIRSGTTQSGGPGQRPVSVPLRGLGVFGACAFLPGTGGCKGFRPLAGIRGIRSFDFHLKWWYHQPAFPSPCGD